MVSLFQIIQISSLHIVDCTLTDEFNSQMNANKKCGEMKMVVKVWGILGFHFALISFLTSCWDWDGREATSDDNGSVFKKLLQIST